ncbi:Uncharacterised protein [Yersinia pseudotuberculosis]|nr:Uncharacterised protein [Yersinia pseudotuberculosis]
MVGAGGVLRGGARFVLGSGLGSVDRRSAFTQSPMPQPPKGSQARDPLWNPRACARIACPLRGCPPSSFRLADGFTRVPPRDA